MSFPLHALQHVIRARKKVNTVMESNVLKIEAVSSILEHCPYVENNSVFITFAVAQCQINCIEKKNRVKHQRKMKTAACISLCGSYMLSPPHRPFLFPFYLTVCRNCAKERKTFCRAGDDELSSQCLQDYHKYDNCLCFLKTYLLKQSVRFFPLPKCHFLPLLWTQL